MCWQTSRRTPPRRCRFFTRWPDRVEVDMKQGAPRHDRPAPNETTVRARLWNSLASLGFLLAAMIAGYVKTGSPPVIIVGGSGLVGFVLWQRTYLNRPTDPAIILPLFPLTVAALDVHMAEGYLTQFGPAM